MAANKRTFITTIWDQYTTIDSFLTPLLFHWSLPTFNVPPWWYLAVGWWGIGWGEGPAQRLAHPLSGPAGSPCQTAMEYNDTWLLGGEVLAGARAWTMAGSSTIWPSRFTMPDSNGICWFVQSLYFLKHSKQPLYFVYLVPKAWSTFSKII